MTTERMAPLSKRGVQQWAEPLLLSASTQCSLLRARFPGFCSNLFTDSPWLPPGCSNSHVLLSNKGTWNQKNWVRPNGQSGVGPVKAVFTGLSAATRPSAPSSPNLTQPIMEASPRAARQPHWAGSLRPRARQKHGTLQPHPEILFACEASSTSSPLCLWSSIPIFPRWLQRVSCDSRIRAKQFPRDGETALQPREP